MEAARTEPPRSVTPAVVKRTRRSRVTNGRSLYVTLQDNNSVVARRLRDLISLHVSDLGGPDAISESEKALVRRASMLILQCELLEQRWAVNGGEASDKSLNTYQKTTGALRRVLQTLGLGRRARDVTPTLGALIRADQDAERRRLANGQRRKHEEPE